MSAPYWQRTAPPRPPVPLPEEADTVVVGGGLTGLTTALLLARAGQQVVVLEADRVGALASGRTTGKVSLLQGTRFSSLLKHHPEEVVRAWLDSQREGLEWLARFSGEHLAADRHERIPAMTYAASPPEVAQVERELEAGERLDLPVVWRDHVDVPFDVHGAVELDDQLQLDPLALVEALGAEVEKHGGRILEESRVVDVSWGSPATVRTEDGRQVRGDHVVIATGSPILDRGLYFARLEPKRSYLLAHEDAVPVPAMMLSAGANPRSLRNAPGGVLLVGGAGHVVGRRRSERDGVDDLRAWVRSTYPAARETHAWSAQDYMSLDGLPYVGALPGGGGGVLVATGYDKWGIASSVAAALRLAGGILGSPPSWAEPLDGRLPRLSSVREVVRRNLGVGVAATTSMAQVVVRSVDPDEPRAPEEDGRVGRSGVDPRPTGVSGECAVRAVCTHLGGTLRWNDAERSWDCPLHGSRFAEDGAVIEGPAVRALPRLE